VAPCRFPITSTSNPLDLLHIAALLVLPPYKWSEQDGCRQNVLITWLWLQKPRGRCDGREQDGGKETTWSKQLTDMVLQQANELIHSC
jgi:hypothetical protein